MGVLNSIRRRNKDMARRRSSKKLLDYSSVSDGSGGTSKDDSADADGLLPDAAPLFGSNLRTSDDPLGPEESNDFACFDNYGDIAAKSPDFVVKSNIIIQQQQEDAEGTFKRTPVEPSGPLGVVVNDDDWDAISHISGISNRPESPNTSVDIAATKGYSPDAKVNPKIVLSPDAAFDRLTSSPLTKVKGKEPAPAIVSPVSQDKPRETSTVALNRSNGSKQSKSDSQKGNGSSGGKVSDMIQKLETNNNEESVRNFQEHVGSHKKNQVHKILRRFEENKIGNTDNEGDESETGSKISHVFEDTDHDSVPCANTNNEDAAAVAAVAASIPAPIYSERLPTPDLVSPEQGDVARDYEFTPTVPAYEAVLDEKHLEKKNLGYEEVLDEENQSEAPAIAKTVAPSFDGSTATVNTNNTTTGNTKPTPVTPQAASAADTVHVLRHVDAIEVTIEEDKKEKNDEGETEEEVATVTPSCQSLSENLKGSISQFTRGFSGFCESASVKAQGVIPQCPQSFTLGTKVEPQKNSTAPAIVEPDNESEVEHPDTSKDISYSTEGSNSYNSDAFDEEDDYPEDTRQPETLQARIDRGGCCKDLHSCNSDLELDHRGNPLKKHKPRYFDRTETMCSF